MKGQKKMKIASRAFRHPAPSGEMTPGYGIEHPARSEKVLELGVMSIPEEKFRESFKHLQGT
jgi:hypothetical protein